MAHLINAQAVLPFRRFAPQAEARNDERRAKSWTFRETIFVWAAQSILICSVIRREQPDAPLELPMLLALTVVGAGWTLNLRAVVAASCGALFLPLLGIPLLVEWPARMPTLFTQLSMIVGYCLLGAVTLLQIQKIQRGLMLEDLLKQQEKTLETARRVQLGILPDALPDSKHFSIALHHDTARTLSGDFYDLKLDGEKLTLCVADVSGKGPPAALVSSMLRGIFEMHRDSGEPAALLASVNRRIHRFLADDMFITCFYAELNIHTGEMSYASAGHEPIYLKKYDGSLVELASTGMPLGLEAELEIFQNHTVLGINEFLVLYTDGLSNAPLGNGERLGEEAVREAIELFSGIQVTALARILSTLTPSLGSRTQDDDVVIIAVSRH